MGFYLCFSCLYIKLTNSYFVHPAVWSELDIFHFVLSIMTALIKVVSTPQQILKELMLNLLSYVSQVQKSASGSWICWECKPRTSTNLKQFLYKCNLASSRTQKSTRTNATQVLILRVSSVKWCSKAKEQLKYDFSTSAFQNSVGCNVYIKELAEWS